MLAKKKTYEDIQMESEILIQKMLNGTLVKHVLPNYASDYTDYQERIDTNRYNAFCRTKFFLELMKSIEEK